MKQLRSFPPTGKTISLLLLTLLCCLFRAEDAKAYVGYLNTNPNDMISWNKCRGSLDIKLYLRKNNAHLIYADVHYKKTDGTFASLYKLDVGGSPAILNNGNETFGGSFTAPLNSYFNTPIGSNPYLVNNDLQAEMHAYDNGVGHTGTLHFYKLPNDILINNGSITIHVYVKWYNENPPGSEYEFPEMELSLPLNSIATPIGVTASQNQCNKVNLSWNMPTQTWTNTVSCPNYGSHMARVYRDGTLIANFLTANSYEDTSSSLLPGVEHSYTVEAFWIADANYRSAGIPSARSGAVVGKLKDPPNQVPNFTVSDDRCDGVVSLNWGWNEQNPQEFQVRRGAAVIATVGGNIRSFTDTITRGTTYTYSIRARNSCSVYSTAYSTDAGISPADPAVVTSVAAVYNTGTAMVNVSWSDNSTNETKFQVVRQDDLGATVYFDINPAAGTGTRTFNDDGVSTCRTYTYKIKVFSDCVQGGLISGSSPVVVVPPPSLSSTFNGTTNKVTGSKGYFTNRVELSWAANNPQNLDQLRIWRKILGTTDSVLIAAVNPSSGLYIDNTCDARVFYEYTLRGERTCNDTVLYSNLTRDVGFRNPMGTISGHIQYEGGIAVADAKVTAVPGPGGDGGYSLRVTGGTVTAPDKASMEPGSELRLDVWVRPINHTNGTVLEKNGAFLIDNSGTNYRVRITTTNGGPYTVNIPEASLPVGAWRNISCQYDGAALTVFVNGVQMGTTPATGDIVNNTSSFVIGGSAQHFYFDELRLMGVAVDSLTAARDYSRYMNGNEAGFKISLHNDEGVGNASYDVSKTGNVYNANHFQIAGSVSWDLIRPSAAELSYTAYTDASGDYIISGIRYNGYGNNYTITPMKGVHSFSPGTRIIYIGDLSQVFNNQDFTDVSSFLVTGTARYYNPDGTAIGCYVDGATLKIDGQPVIRNGQPVMTDATGAFSIQVPIGQHNVSIEKFQHTFSDSVFPPSGNWDFQEPVSGIAFKDTTTRLVVGRVVGGMTEAEKAPGMGRSENNLGVAKIRFQSPVTGTPCHVVTVNTNPLTGEYNLKLPPLQYKVDTVFVITAPNTVNPSSLTNAGTTFNLKNFTQPVTETDTLFGVGNSIVSIDSITYTKELNFIHRVPPTVNFLDTLGNKFIGEDTLFFEGAAVPIPSTASTWGPFGWPVFRQGKTYHGDVSAVEIYTNYDNLQKDTVLLKGNVLFTNELINGADPMAQVPLVDGKARYSFVAGDPNNSTGAITAFNYTEPLEITVVPQGAQATAWRPNATAYPANPQYRGYIVGSKITGTGISTLGPERVDYILRDPAGSGSFATWTSGHSATQERQFSAQTAGAVNVSAEVKVGFEQSVGLGVQVPVEVEVTAGVGLEISASALTGGGFVETITSSNSVSTRDDADNVGAAADIFIGRSRNWLVGPTSNIELIDAGACSSGGTVCFGPTVNGKRLSKKLGYAIQPSTVKTRFSYTQQEIETVVIPTLEALRATKLTAPTYTNILPASDPHYGANNDDPVFGAGATTTTPFVYEAADAAGPSYTFNGTNMDNDTVRTINQQIALWKQALAQNEREKWKAINNQGGMLIDNFTLGSAIVSNSYEVNSEASSVLEWELSLSAEQKTTIGAEAGGVGASVERTLSLSETIGGSATTTTGSTTAFEYTLTDGDPGDIFSIDVYSSSEGTGNIFVTRGGRSMCPYEDAVQPHYFNPANPNAPITSHTYIANPSATIQLATIRREMPQITITPSNQFNIPSNQSAVYQLILTNQSPEVVDNDIDMRVRVASQSNPNGAIVKIDGLDPNTYYTIPAGANVVKTLTVERGPVYTDYDSLMIIFSSACSNDIADTSYISVHFIPTCTELALVNPTNNWILNNTHQDELLVKISDYNYNYGAATVVTPFDTLNLGFNKIGFEMKPSNSGTWLQIEQFLKYPGTLDSVIPNNDVFTQYPWDVSQIPDGNYELRAKSYCMNFDGSFSTKISPVFAGVMDRIHPAPFGTPSPADGILDPNDDISIQFNEPLELGSINWPNFQVRGILNVSGLRHAEFLSFDGTDDYVEVPGGVGLQSKNFTIEFWARIATTGQQQVIVSQGIDPAEAMNLGFTAGNNLELKLNGETVTSNAPVANPTAWNHYAAVYNFDNNEAYLYQNGTLLNSGNVNLAANYNGSGKLYFGKQVPQNAAYFSGHLHEVRVWNKMRTAGELVASLNTVLSSNTAGLVHNWQMDEATGLIAADKIRERNAVLYGTSWQVDPNGFSAEFDGTNDYLAISSSTIPITENMDATIEFWFNSTQAVAATLFSSGKGDGLGLDSLTGWEINKDASGYIHVLHNGNDFAATDSNYFDGSWHHFALVLNRSANLSVYIDGNLQNGVQAIGLGAIAGSNFTVGARGYNNSGGTYVQDQFFQGKLDEVRVWNAARKFEQIRRDRNNRMKGDEYALTAHLPFESYAIVMGVPALTAQIANNAPAFPLATVTANGGATTNAQTPVIKLPRPVESVNFNWLLNNDKIVITPTTAPELLENQTIDITVKDLYDLHGNKMESPKTWIAYFNKNQVYWQQDLLSYDIALDSALQFTATILNTGGASKAYTISGMPAWLSADISSGVIAPNSSQVVHFTVEDGMNVGQYYADIAVTTDFNYDELLRVSLNVHGTPPNWVLDPTDFQYSMSVIGQIKLDGVINGNPGTQIAGFMHDTLCALGSLQYVPAYDRYEVFLNLLSNTEIGDSVHFEIYDANTGNVYVYVTPSIWFADGELMGTIANPITFNGSLTLQKDIPLHAGWTWISLPLASQEQGSSNDLMAEIPATNGDVIKGQTIYDQYDSGTGWIGSITGNGGYQNVASYKVRIAQADTLKLIGTRIHPDSSFAQINLVQGWNWIGFMSTKNLPLGEALGNYTPNDGDLIKSQYQFAYYDALSHSWIGSLTTMVPGMGYVMQTSAAGSFHYPLSAYLRSESAEQPQIDPFYDFVPESFAKTMSATVYSNLCVKEEDRESIVLGAFDQANNLRGFALYKTDPATEKHFWYLTVYSNDNAETLSLKFFDNATGALIPTDAAFDFEEDVLLGTNAEPFIARVSAVQPCDGIAEETESTITVEPNPFSDEVAVTFEEDFSGTIGIYDLNGKLLFVKAVSNTSTYVISEENVYGVMADGVYMLRITGNDGHSEQKRIIKLNK